MTATPCAVSLLRRRYYVYLLYKYTLPLLSRLFWLSFLCMPYYRLAFLISCQSLHLNRLRRLCSSFLMRSFTIVCAALYAAAPYCFVILSRRSAPQPYTPLIISSASSSVLFVLLSSLSIMYLAFFMWAAAAALLLFTRLLRSAYQLLQALALCRRLPLLLFS